MEKFAVTVFFKFMIHKFLNSVDGYTKIFVTVQQQFSLHSQKRITEKYIGFLKISRIF